MPKNCLVFGKDASGSNFQHFFFIVAPKFLKVAHNVVFVPKIASLLEMKFSVVVMKFRSIVTRLDTEKSAETTSNIGINMSIVTHLDTEKTADTTSNIGIIYF